MKGRRAEHSRVHRLVREQELRSDAPPAFTEFEEAFCHRMAVMPEPRAAYLYAYEICYPEHYANLDPNRADLAQNILALATRDDIANRILDYRTMISATSEVTRESLVLMLMRMATFDPLAATEPIIDPRTNLPTGGRRVKADIPPDVRAMISSIKLGPGGQVKEIVGPDKLAVVAQLKQLLGLDKANEGEKLMANSLGALLGEISQASSGNLLQNDSIDAEYTTVAPTAALPEAEAAPVEPQRIDEGMTEMDIEAIRQIKIPQAPR